MWQIFVISLLIIAISVIFLSVRLFIGRQFVHTHIDGNKVLQSRGIHCAQSFDADERREKKCAIKESK